MVFTVKHQPRASMQKSDQLSQNSSKRIQILFLKNDEKYAVEAIETTTLPYLEIIERLNYGESIFISNKPVKNRKELNKKPSIPADIWYLNRY